MKKIDLPNLFRKKTEIIDFQQVNTPAFYFNRDWRIIIFAFAFGLISITIFSFQIFLSNKIGGGYLSSEIVLSDTPIKIIDQKKIKNTISSLEKKDAEMYKNKASQAKIVDPSL